ncbi:DnaJ domain-containing protein [Haloprofundus salilacus]|uniref:DnaJ domain-containing protein n=1 Tax=Haloprofundus salilacus TaxID=2876190 RepID=UPI001CCE7EDE|nr:DnaJ domain-containing protein [Haloprofundus salilacus]
MPENFYDLLGVSDDATQAELKAAYRAKAREYHPDVNDDDRATAQFQTIRRAYDVLSDESERADYERLGHATYVKKRMKGYPSASRWGGDDESADASGSASTTSGSSAASSRSSRSTTSKSTASTNRSSTGASSSQTASTAGSARSRSTRRRSSSRTSGATAGGHDPDAANARARARQARRARRRQQRNKTDARSRRRRTLSYHWASVLGATILYVAGVAQFLLGQRPALESFATELASAPSTALTGSFGLTSLLEFVLASAQTPAATPEALLFPVGAVALPLSLVVTVSRFGKGATWLYAVGSFAPLAALGLSAALATMVAPTLVLVVLVPVLSASLFLGDVGRYLWATR